MMVRFQFLDLHIIPVLFRIIRVLRLFTVRNRTLELGLPAKAVFTSLTLSHEKWRLPMLPRRPYASPCAFAGWSPGRCSVITDWDPSSLQYTRREAYAVRPNFFLRRVTIKSSFDIPSD